MFACWQLRIERNKRVFVGKCSDVSVIVDSIIWTVSSWASRDKVFYDVSWYGLTVSWEVYFRGGCSPKHVSPLWSLPSVRMLKLKF